jgi:putative sugar O-methyltransferase
MSAALKWILNRVFLLKKELYSLYEKIIYQKQSQFLLHFWNAHRCPYEAILFYSFVGRVLFATKEFIALMSGGRLFKKEILLDGFDYDIKTFYSKGSHERLWPRSPFIDHKTSIVEERYFKKIERALKLSYKYYHDSMDKTEDWEVVSKKFKALLFDEEGNFQKEALIYFRENHHFERIIADTFAQVDTTESYISAYLKGIDLVLEYHRSAKIVDKEILASLSESYAGNSTCVHYRGQRLSEKLLFYAVATDDILKHVPFEKRARNVILDIGTGYGALPAILKYYIPNSCYILTDLPEVITFSAYYIKYHFPDKKIALLDDVIETKRDFTQLIKEYDFIILPSKAIEDIPDGMIDLVINTASLGFLSHEYLNFYLAHIDRVLKEEAYFYSINKTDTCKWGIGMYEWPLDGYLTCSLAFNNRFSYPQWLGKKIDTKREKNV